MNQDIEEVLDELKIDNGTRENSNIESLPESPASANIKFWISGFGVMITMRDNEVNNVLKKVQTVIELAKEKGWQPSWEVKVLPKTEPTVDAPKCGVHGVPMIWKAGISKKSGRPYAFWSCSTKNADGSYCQYSPPKEQV